MSDFSLARPFNAMAGSPSSLPIVVLESGLSQGRLQNYKWTRLEMRVLGWRGTADKSAYGLW